jgi:hypothetical protein
MTKASAVDSMMLMFMHYSHGSIDADADVSVNASLMIIHCTMSD